MHRDSGEGEEDDSDGTPKSKGPTPFPGNISPRMLWDLKRALIVKTSHVGQHKFAGNAIVSELASFDLMVNTDQAPSLHFFCPIFDLDTDLERPEEGL